MCVVSGAAVPALYDMETFEASSPKIIPTTSTLTVGLIQTYNRRLNSVFDLLAHFFCDPKKVLG